VASSVYHRFTKTENNEKEIKYKAISTHSLEKDPKVNENSLV